MTVKHLLKLSESFDTNAMLGGEIQSVTVPIFTDDMRINLDGKQKWFMRHYHMTTGLLKIKFRNLVSHLSVKCQLQSLKENLVFNS